MNKIDNWLTHDHSWQEEILARCQDAVDVEDWSVAKSAFQELISELKRHIMQEEEVVYPAYDAEVKAPNTPTDSLRDDHEKIIAFLKDIRDMIETEDSDHVLDCLGQLEKLMSKHHEKEEDIFLPMASLILTANREEILEKLENYDESRSDRKWKF